MDRRSLMLTGAASLLAGCAGRWKVDYERPVDSAVSRGWHVHDVLVAIPEKLTVSHSNTFAPNADIVWHGEPFGNRRAQVRAIMQEGLRLGVQELNGPRAVNIASNVVHFHAVTPAAVGRAPAAVHNIAFTAQVIDDDTGEPLVEMQTIHADLEAFVGSAAVAAAINGNSQRARIVNHIGRVTRSWLGFGPDQRRTFQSVGR